MSAIIGFCTLTFNFPDVFSLKDKRSILKSMLKRLHNTFNISAAETDHHDVWQSAQISLVLVSNSSTQSHKVLQSAIKWIEDNYPDALITQQNIEIL